MFHELGFSPVALASLFILYEVAGIFTSFLGGWIGTRVGLNKMMVVGLLAQVVAVTLLTVNQALLSVIYVMVVQGLAGVAKDLVKVSSKSSIKAIVPSGEESVVFTFVSLLTGSKNALKGVGFLVGGFLLAGLGLRMSMVIMAGVLLLTALVSVFVLPKDLGVSKKKKGFKTLFSKSRAITVLSLARFFLFGSRDLWFVIGLPVFLQSGLGWSFEKVSGFLALWVIGYGISQTVVPKFFNGEGVGARSLALWSGALCVFPAGIALAISAGFEVERVLVGGLLLYGVFFAVNSILHSYLVLAYSDEGNVAADVGFYYMANAGGRLVGTLLSGAVFQIYGFVGVLWVSVVFLICAAGVSVFLPKRSL